MPVNIEKQLLDEIIYIGKSVSGGVQIIFISGRLY
jgi:hypothetical protein